jgi:predicted ribosomally synthesized peptide with nif11-like leader
MSIAQVRNFIDRLAADQTLRRQLEDAVAGKDEAAALAGVVAVGAKAGFVFNAEEARRTRQAILKLASGSAALDEDELELVAGGAGKLDGIQYLVAVTQMKANNANDDALGGSSGGGTPTSTGGTVEGGRFFVSW